jgi:NAD(P)H-dependent FMN reductase
LNKINILAISGSLRASSSNTSILQAAIKLAPDNVEITLYEGLGELPHFNPDIDNDNHLPDVVQTLRRELNEADGVMICTPEYAHNIPGSLKNLLDWNVSTCLLSNKPVAVIATGEYAQQSLLETLWLIEAKTWESTTLLIPYSQSRIDAEGNIKDAETIQALKELLYTFVQMIDQK